MFLLNQQPNIYFIYCIYKLRQAAQDQFIVAMGCILDRIRDGRAEKDKKGNAESRVRLEGGEFNEGKGKKQGDGSTAQIHDSKRVNRIRAEQSGERMNVNPQLNEKPNTRKKNLDQYEQLNAGFESRNGKLVESRGSINFTSLEKESLQPYLINLKNLANAEDEQGLNEKSLKHHRKYLYLVSRMDYRENGEEIVLAEKDVAWLQFKRGNAEKAERNLSECFDKLGEGTKKAHVEVRCCQANIKLIQCEYEQSLQLYNRSLEMQKKIDSSNLVYANILTKLGLVYYHLQKYDEAIFNYTESLGLIEKLEGKESMEYGRTLGNLGNTFVAQKKYGQARQNYKECINICKTNNQVMSSLCSNSFVCFGNSYLQEKRYKEAVTYYEQAKVIEKQLNSTQLLQTLEKIMKCYLQLANKQLYRQAKIDYLEQSFYSLQDS